MPRETLAGAATLVLLLTSSCGRAPSDAREGGGPVPVAASSPAPPPEAVPECASPEVTVTPPAAPRQLGSKNVKLSMSVPRFGGRDGAVLQRHFDTYAGQALPAREREWKECQTQSKLGLACPPWKIETECQTATAGKVFSVACIHRLTDAPDVRPSVTYDAVNLVRCGDEARLLDLEKDACPSWACLDALRNALVGAGLRRDALPPDASKVKDALGRFHLSAEHIVFFLGDASTDNLEFDERFLFGYNVAALPYSELARAAPGSDALLRRLGLPSVPR